MRIDNVCGVCNAINETENHLFFRCEFSHVFWFCSPLHLNSHALEGSDFLESWSNFCAQVKDRNNADDIRQEFAFGLWRLWKNRNDVIFKGIYRQPLDILEAWRKSTSEYKDCLARDEDDNRPRLPKTIKASETFCTKWQKPRFGTIKINSDAAWCKDTMRMGTVSFAFVPREGNRAAHSMAKYAFKEGRSFSWDCIGPEFLFNILAKDVNLSIRL
ncbi:unnamed protein product [Malus baccata var. baccata]